MFENIDEKFLIVGNGAAELINNLKNVISGKIAVCTTFNNILDVCRMLKLLKSN